MQTKERKIMKKPWTEIILTYNSLHFDHEVEFSAQYYKDHVHLE